MTPRLAGLVRRELIRPDRPQFAGEDAFRFRHLLIRDAAYEALPKSLRAPSCTSASPTGSTRGAELVELDEIVGYHLEQAARYSRELGRPADDVAARAGDRLAAAGRRALWRGDDRAAAGAARARARADQADATRRPARRRLRGDDVHRGLPPRSGDRRRRRRASASGGGCDRRGVRTCDTRVPPLQLLNERTSMSSRHLLLTALPLLEQKTTTPRSYTCGRSRPRRVELARSLGGLRAGERAGAGARRLAGQQRTGLFWIEIALALGPLRPRRHSSNSTGCCPRRQPVTRCKRAWLLAMLDRFDEAVPLAREPTSGSASWTAASSARTCLARSRGLGAITRRGAPPRAPLRLARGTRTGRALRDLPISPRAGPLRARPLRRGRASCSPGTRARRTKHIPDRQLWREVQARVLAHRGTTKKRNDSPARPSPSWSRQTR